MESLSAALRAGAGSVYFGVGGLNMRSRAAVNFAIGDMDKIVRLCHSRGARAYLALNVIVYDDELKDVDDILAAAAAAGVDAVIASDLAVMRRAKSLGLPVHVSVQANISNFEALSHFAEFADAVVLARELSLPRIRSIIERIESRGLRGPSGELVKIELFAHGALCVALSGKCHMSLAIYDSSANRGACFQNCRRAYRVIDEQTGDELVVDNQFVMSPKDLCTISVLGEMLDAGISILKIEGRGRSADYVGTVVAAYRRMVEAWSRGRFNRAAAEAEMRDLEKVFNRGFWTGGYYLGEDLGEWCGESGNMAAETKTIVGAVTNYYTKISVVEISVKEAGFELGDELLITGKTTGAERLRVEEIRSDDGVEAKAVKGMVVGVSSPVKLRRGDKVHLLKPRRFGEKP